MILADMGADVIKIGNHSKPWKPKSSSITGPLLQVKDEKKREETIAAYTFMHRNKKNIMLNLKKEEDKEMSYELVKRADTPVEAYSPGVSRRLGIDYSALNILCHHWPRSEWTLL